MLFIHRVEIQAVSVTIKKEIDLARHLGSTICSRQYSFVETYDTRQRDMTTGHQQEGSD